MDRDESKWAKRGVLRVRLDRLCGASYKFIGESIVPKSASGDSKKMARSSASVTR